jgi:hypothetical protein
MSLQQKEAISLDKKMEKSGSYVCNITVGCRQEPPMPSLQIVQHIHVLIFNC